VPHCGEQAEEGGWKRVGRRDMSQRCGTFCLEGSLFESFSTTFMKCEGDCELLENLSEMRVAVKLAEDVEVVNSRHKKDGDKS
jgi:hypothetical protein